MVFGKFSDDRFEESSLLAFKYLDKDELVQRFHRFSVTRKLHIVSSLRVKPDPCTHTRSGCSHGVLLPIAELSMRIHLIFMPFF